MPTHHPDNPLSSFLHQSGIIRDDSRICQFPAMVSITTASHSLADQEVQVSATIAASRHFGRQIALCEIESDNTVVKEIRQHLSNLYLLISPSAS